MTIFFSTCTDIVSSGVRYNNSHAKIKISMMITHINIVGNGMMNATIALARTIHTDPKVSLRATNFPASALGASDKVYAFAHGLKNNRQKLENIKVRIKVTAVNSNIKQRAATMNAMVVSLSILMYPYLSRRYPAGISNISCTMEPSPIKIPTIQIGITCSPRGESKVKCNPAQNLNIAKNIQNGRYSLNNW